MHTFILSVHVCKELFFFFFKFYAVSLIKVFYVFMNCCFIYLFILLHNIILVLPYIDLNPPWVYMCSPLKKAPTSTASFPSAVRLPQASLPPQDLPNASSCLQSFRAAVWPGGVSTPSSNHNPQASGHRGCARGRCIPWPV